MRFQQTPKVLNLYCNLGVLAVITPQILFVVIPVICVAIKLQKYYFASAKELMRINGTTKSLVANHLAESLSGAMTIIVFKEEDRFFAKSLELIDKNASPFFLNFSSAEWLNLHLEMMSVVVLCSSALVMALLPPGTFSPGFVGMALSYGLTLSRSLLSAIQSQCTVANNIISVERLNQYMHVSSEAPVVINENRPAPNWPPSGRVELHDLKKLGNGDILEKLISSYEQVGDGSVLEDVLFAKYQNSISYLERAEKEIASNPDFGRLNRSGILEEMQTHLDTLEECTNKLAASELSRTTLLSHLREAILEQEGKIEQAHDYIQASESKSEQLNIISNKLQDCKICRASEQNVKEAPDALNVSANLIPDVPASSGG